MKWGWKTILPDSCFVLKLHSKSQLALSEGPLSSKKVSITTSGKKDDVFDWNLWEGNISLDTLWPNPWSATNLPHRNKDFLVCQQGIKVGAPRKSFWLLCADAEVAGSCLRFRSCNGITLLRDFSSAEKQQVCLLRKTFSLVDVLAQLYCAAFTVYHVTVLGELYSEDVCLLAQYQNLLWRGLRIWVTISGQFYCCGSFIRCCQLICFLDLNLGLNLQESSWKFGSVCAETHNFTKTWKISPLSKLEKFSFILPETAFWFFELTKGFCARVPSLVNWDKIPLSLFLWRQNVRRHNGHITQQRLVLYKWALRNKWHLAWAQLFLWRYFAQVCTSRFIRQTIHTKLLCSFEWIWD